MHQQSKHTTNSTTDSGISLAGAAILGLALISGGKALITGDPVLIDLSSPNTLTPSEVHQIAESIDRTFEREIERIESRHKHEEDVFDLKGFSFPR
ncbi:MAG: hypothetical protein KDD42_09315 [Bdellovibrionales bacterium]|nr:hypothetical protein [Bdellovibrionales bacterium]